jgi:hypothetical protein
MFGAQRRFVARAEKLTLCPNIECFPQISQVPVPANGIDPPLLNNVFAVLLSHH